MWCLYYYIIPLFSKCHQTKPEAKDFAIHFDIFLFFQTLTGKLNVKKRGKKEKLIINQSINQ